jgi:hypothetical protein
VHRQNDFIHDRTSQRNALPYVHKVPRKFSRETTRKTGFANGHHFQGAVA